MRVRREAPLGATTPLSEALERELEEGVSVTPARDADAASSEAIEESSSTSGLGGILTAEQTSSTHRLLPELPPRAAKRAQTRTGQRRRKAKR